MINKEVKKVSKRNLDTHDGIDAIDLQSLYANLFYLT